MRAVTGRSGLALRWRRHLVRGVALGLGALLLSSLPWLWTTMGAYGHVYDEAEAPTADVVIVLGTAVAADGRQPGDRLAGRLETAAALVHSERARVVLVSGDGGGTSGDEPAVMTSYLTERLGVDPGRVVADPFGLDTYDSCARAREVYGVERALIVTQSYHLSRAVTLCRHLGLDVDGVAARCSGCGSAVLVGKAVREYFASGKAAWDAFRRRPPAVHSPANPGIQDALKG
ncbi:protein SanA, affects membrane permeability for vancomycin [Micromonospora echinaurantiaca]|uniref:Protein SanA, affects membrane permeability for vancomycin n=1 Tax=Micromonospora echinaurantiaca TaxID=47857 RepID=A0A1C5K9U9_9ACTN|nr:protein SanA, affects membrane permeability for vancomycin [Micromonospora echinaurantiaca]